jgi:hypothetical protein
VPLSQCHYKEITMPATPSSSNRSGISPDRGCDKLTALRTAFAALIAELESLPIEDRIIVLDTTFLSISGVLLQARTCAAALVCDARVRLDGGGKDGNQSATDEFFRKFRDSWLTSVLVTPSHSTAT